MHADKSTPAIIPAAVDAREFLHLALKLPVVDVRSQGEYRQGHIPHAYNIPLFDNEERAQVGTTYVKVGKEQAVELGISIASRKTRYYLESLGPLDASSGILLHCWRGGLRSEKIAAFYSENGIRVFVLQGGYKAYRNYIRQQFVSDRPVLLIGGYTGTGKTEILGKLQASGQQTIDLEMLAHHKGSLFGHLGQAEQPTTEQFENNLFEAWDQTDPLRPLWLEHESLSIGSLYLPATFYSAMRSGTQIFLEVDRHYRIERIVKEYGHFGTEALSAVLQKLGTFMDRAQTAEAIKALQLGDLEKVADITLKYYDKVYANSLIRKPVKTVHRIRLQGADTGDFAAEVLDFAKKNALL